jgi:DNA ligase 1
VAPRRARPAAVRYGAVMRFETLVRTAAEVADAPARRGKVALLAGLLRRLAEDEVALAAGLLSGRPRQGRIGVAWATLDRIEVEPAPEPSLELLDVDGALSALLAAVGSGSRAERLALLTDLFARATAAEAAFLRGLLQGELRQGALEGVLAQAIAAAWSVDEDLVRRAAMLGGDLADVAGAAASGGTEALRAFRLQLLRPVQPMLALSAPSLTEALAGLESAVVEWKLDGARIQVHREGRRVRVYTRALRDVTASLADVAAAVRGLPAERIVLDGEALALRDDGRPAPFQESMQRGADLRAFFFDVLHLGGADLVDAPLRERRAALHAVLPPDMRVPGEEVSGLAAAEAYARGHEGVMVKVPAAPYQAGRRGAAWRKVKPVHTLDLVVLAVEWGSGRRRGLLSNLHLGARADDGDGFVMLGKTFKGLSDELLAYQTRELLARETRREGHVVHVRPELVVEVACDGVQASSRYPGGVALRFARVRRYRDDKTAAEADTLATVRRLFERPPGQPAGGG